jgi:hypothetical protein
LIRILLILLLLLLILLIGLLLILLLLVLLLRILVLLRLGLVLLGLLLLLVLLLLLRLMILNIGYIILVSKLRLNFHHIDWINLRIPVGWLLDLSKILWRSLYNIDWSKSMRCFITATDASINISFNNQWIFTSNNSTHAWRGFYGLMRFAIKQLYLRSDTVILSFFFSYIHTV